VDDGRAVRAVPIIAASIIFRITREQGRWKARWVTRIGDMVPRGK